MAAQAHFLGDYEIKGGDSHLKLNRAGNIVLGFTGVASDNHESWENHPTIKKENPVSNNNAILYITMRPSFS